MFQTQDGGARQHGPIYKAVLTGCCFKLFCLPLAPSTSQTDGLVFPVTLVTDSFLGTKVSTFFETSVCNLFSSPLHPLSPLTARCLQQGSKGADLAASLSPSFPLVCCFWVSQAVCVYTPRWEDNYCAQWAVARQHECHQSVAPSSGFDGSSWFSRVASLSGHVSGHGLRPLLLSSWDLPSAPLPHKTHTWRTSKCYSWSWWRNGPLWVRGDCSESKGRLWWLWRGVFVVFLPGCY